MLQDFNKEPRLAGAAWALLALFVVAGLTQVRTQVIARKEVLAEAKRNSKYIVRRTDTAKRGTIRAADNSVLARSEESYILGIDYRRVPKSPGFFMALAEATRMSASELQQPGLSCLRSRTWQSQLSPSQYKEIYQVKSDWRADGISLYRSTAREYPMGEATATLIGQYVGSQSVSGLEMGADSKLEGTDGFREGLVDRTGAFLPMRLNRDSVPVKNGQDIKLTILPSLQQTAHNLLKQAVVKNDAERGVAIVMDPHTGDLLAVANWPSFDPSSGGPMGGANPAFQNVFEPGSTFKILTLAEALEKNKVQVTDSMDCTGTLAYNKSWRIRCDEHHGNRAHGSLTCERAIAKSCNVAAASWALKIGYPDMVTYLDALGLTGKPGVGMPLEANGRFNRHEYAKPLQLMTVGFGQSMAATPVSLASAFSMLANGGVRMRPRLIKAVNGEEVPLAPGTPIVRQSVAEDVLSVMESVIETDEGTGAVLRIPGYRLAGKTGTAQKIGSLKKGEVGYVSSFVGFVPADQPRAVVLVMVDNPRGKAYYGATVAGPVFKGLAREILTKFDVPESGAAHPVSLAKYAPVRRASAEPQSKGAIATTKANGNESLATRHIPKVGKSGRGESAANAIVVLPPKKSATPRVSPTAKNAEAVAMVSPSHGPSVEFDFEDGSMGPEGRSKFSESEVDVSVSARVRKKLDPASRPDPSKLRMITQDGKVKSVEPEPLDTRTGERTRDGDVQAPDGPPKPRGKANANKADAALRGHLVQSPKSRRVGTARTPIMKGRIAMPPKEQPLVDGTLPTGVATKQVATRVRSKKKPLSANSTIRITTRGSALRIPRIVFEENIDTSLKSAKRSAKYPAQLKRKSTVRPSAVASKMVAPLRPKGPAKKPGLRLRSTMNPSTRAPGKVKSVIRRPATKKAPLAQSKVVKKSKSQTEPRRR